MALYKGLSAERLSGKPCIETVDEDVRFLAEHVQLYLQNMEPPKEDLVLLHVRLEPSNGNGGQVDQVMRGLGYAMFELNEGYRDTIKAKGLTPADVLNGLQTFPGLVDLLKP